MTSFYQFLIWFFTIVSLVALMYGVLSADITFIGLFISTLIISVIFYRLNETSPSKETPEEVIKDFNLEVIDNDNSEISEAVEALKREQIKILSIFKRDIYSNEDLSSILEIKKKIVLEFVSSLTLNFEMVSKQELKDLILKLLNNLIEKNSDHLFEPSFFPSEQLSYVNWVRKSLLLLGWKVRNGEDSINKIFSNLFEKNGMIVGVIVFSETAKVNIDQKQHHHCIQEGAIDFSVVITPDFKGIKNEQISNRVITVNHNDLPKLHLKLKNLLAPK
tara:strand:- start:25 stop:852 length:828 start_codon:yes stop_codon:yes gene_type:complete